MPYLQNLVNLNKMLAWLMINPILSGFSDLEQKKAVNKLTSVIGE